MSKTLLHSLNGTPEVVYYHKGRACGKSETAFQFLTTLDRALPKHTRVLMPGMVAYLHPNGVVRMQDIGSRHSVRVMGVDTSGRIRGLTANAVYIDEVSTLDIESEE